MTSSDLWTKLSAGCQTCLSSYLGPSYCRTSILASERHHLDTQHVVISPISNIKD